MPIGNICNGISFGHDYSVQCSVVCLSTIVLVLIFQNVFVELRKPHELLEGQRSTL